jgi:hypothetical protein
MTPTRDQELAVLQSVIYASLFDYPLTLDQLHGSLVGVRADEAAAIASWWRESELLQATVEHRDGWYFPAGRGDLIETRARREAVSRELLVRDRRILALVRAMPFVRMVALSGSLAHLNAEGSADLDLFVITAPHRVWSVTFAVLVLSRLLGFRKRICLNYVVSEHAMRIVPEDLFAANQIIHLRPMFGRRMFHQFVRTNAWVQRFYPNFEIPGARERPPQWTLKVSERLLGLGVAPLFERFARAFYGRHLRSRAATWQSRDQVRLEPECLKLHTSSHRASILTRFDLAMVDALARFDEDARREVAASRS